MPCDTSSSCPFPLYHARTRYARQERHRTASLSSFRFIEDDLSHPASRSIRAPNIHTVRNITCAKRDKMQRSCVDDPKRVKFSGFRSHPIGGCAEKANVELPEYLAFEWDRLQYRFWCQSWRTRLRYLEHRAA